MVCPLYLAMTAAEFLRKPTISHPVAWMSCRFSPFGRGLSNVPASLPEGSMLMIDDFNPPNGHDPEEIAKQLRKTVAELKISKVLLDFQRGGDPLTQDIAEAVLSSLPCPAAVALPYTRDGFPVLLPPVPPQTAIAEHLAAYKGREIWLELAVMQTCATVTENGCIFEDAEEEWDTPSFYDESLYCHYQTKVSKDSIRFLLTRQKADVFRLLEEVEELDITCCVGLYRELK